MTPAKVFHQLYEQRLDNFHALGLLIQAVDSTTKKTSKEAAVALFSAAWDLSSAVGRAELLAAPKEALRRRFHSVPPAPNHYKIKKKIDEDSKVMEQAALPFLRRPQDILSPAGRFFATILDA
eukprot:GABV01006604.1.p1 GENE.GABV01006604.1~~GABV01006604.1.p1  ORF type:complete len:123 (-),score=36.20 GABV01006604.1:3-371(-)